MFGRERIVKTSGFWLVLTFRMRHKAIPRNVNLSDYLVSVKNIEDDTGLDFLNELPDDLENTLETTVWGLWPDLE